MSLHRTLPHMNKNREFVGLASLYVVLPAYNEGQALLNLVVIFNEAVKNLPLKVLVIDDGSQDDSMSLLESANLEYCSVIRHVENRGLGEAVKTGFKAALAQADDDDMILVMDSDGTHNPYLVGRMIGLIQEGNDVVVASRYRYGSQVIGLSWFREFLSHGASWVYRMTVPINNIKDYTCGFRLYRAGILRQAFQVYGEGFISESGFACMAEIIVKLAKLGGIFCEVPMILRYDRKVSTSKIKIVKTVFSSLSLVSRFLAGSAKAD